MLAKTIEAVSPEAVAFAADNILNKLVLRALLNAGGMHFIF
jgi:hypothetical protein